MGFFASDAEQRVPARRTMAFYQLDDRPKHRQHFANGAYISGKRDGTIRAFGSQCRRGTVGFESGADIIDALVATRSCLSRGLRRVHIFGHAFSQGVAGRGLGRRGLYVPTASWVSPQRTQGGRLITDIPLDVFAANAQFVLHGCNLASGPGSFAEQLFDHLATGLPNPQVAGHHNAGCAGRDNSWRVFTRRAPSGRRVSRLPAAVWRSHPRLCG